MSLPRVAIVCDLREEGWPSMELAAEMLLSHLAADHRESFCAERVQPAARLRLSKAGADGRGWMADRLLNRFWDYPRELVRRRTQFDLFHLVDHSYSQLVHYLPQDRTIVTCHDLDTFRSILRPDLERRSLAYRAMTRRILSGFQQASRVICVSEATRSQVETHGLVPPERLRVVTNGVHPTFHRLPDPASQAAISSLLGPRIPGEIELLHVGSTIPRKRIDILLRVLAEVHRRGMPVRLIRVGGPFTPQQRALLEELGVTELVRALPALTPEELAAVYHRGDILLQTSESEGFGLPVAEAMACGTPVVATDIPALREVGGDAASFCSLSDIESWGEVIATLDQERRLDTAAWESRRERCIQRAGRFSWGEHARGVAAVYREVLSG